jgi:hypothetical protein
MSRLPQSFEESNTDGVEVTVLSVAVLRINIAYAATPGTMHFLNKNIRACESCRCVYCRRW